jgi:hypothetical protein
MILIVNSDYLFKQVIFVMLELRVLCEVRTEFKIAYTIWVGRGGGRKSILLEGNQAMPARPSDKDIMGVKTLGWWVVKAWDRDGRIWFHD